MSAVIDRTDRALAEIVECLLDWGQFPKDGRASVKLVELVNEDSIYDFFTEAMMQTSPEALYRLQREFKEVHEAFIRDRLETPEYRWIVSDLADWMERNADADRWEDNE